MEVCVNCALNPPFRPSLPLKPQSLFRLHTNYSGDVWCKRSYLRASMSEETPTDKSKFDGETSNRILVLEADKNTFSNNNNKNSSVEVVEEEEEPSLDKQMQPLAQLFDKLNLKLDMENSYSLLLYGGGALVSVWLLSAVVGAVESIPLFPQLMEVVGLSYSVWFTTRYLIFKKNRDELVAKIEELKQQVVGSD